MSNPFYPIEHLPTKCGGHTTVVFVIKRAPGWWRKGIVTIFGESNWELVNDEVRDQIRQQWTAKNYRLVENRRLLNG